MIVHVLMIFLNELSKGDRMTGSPSCNEFNLVNDTRALMFD